MKHAKLSASGSARWLTCPGSVHAESDIADKNNSFSLEGTCAHELGEVLLKDETLAPESFIGKSLTDAPDVVIDSNMVDYIVDYVGYCRSFETNTSTTLIETRVDFSEWVPEGFGTADCIILDDGVVNVIDLKYGMTPVEVKNNSQAMLYALGVLNDYGMLYEFETFNLHIYQPRINNISTWAISRSELLQWSEYVRVRALACLDVNAPRIPSEAGCHWCKAKATCPALTAHVEKVIGAEFDDLTLPPVEQANVKAILDNKKLIEQFLTAVEEYAFDTIESGGGVPGYKVVEAITHRRWKDNAQDAVRAALGDAAFGEPKMITPAQAVKLAPELAEYVFKPTGKSVIVPESDKRQAKMAVINMFENNA